MKKVVIRDEPGFVKYTLKKYVNGDVNIEIDRYLTGKDGIHLPKESVKLLKENL